MKPVELDRARAVVVLVAILAGIVPAFAWDGGTAQVQGRAPVVEDPSVESLRHRAVSDGDGGVVVAWQHGRAGGIRLQVLGESGIRKWQAAHGVVISATGLEPSIAPAPAGGATVAWEERAGGGSTIRAQLVDADGAARWSAGGILVGNSGSRPVVRSDAIGGAWVAWSDPRTGSLRVAHLDAQGTLDQPGVDLGAGPSHPEALRIVPDDASGVTAVWSDGGRVHASHVTIGGTPGAAGTAVSDPGAGLRLAGAVSDGFDGVLVAWFAGERSRQLRVQRLDRRGEILWTPGGVVVVDSEIVGGDPQAWTETVAARLAPDGSGGTIVAWSDPRDADGPVEVYLQRFDAHGRRVWSPHGVAVRGNDFLGRSAIDLVPDGAGGVVVTFEELSGVGRGSASTLDIAAARFGADGNRLWLRPVYTNREKGQAWDQRRPRIVFDGSGSWPPEAIVVWRDVGFGDLYARTLAITSPANDLCANAEVVTSGDHTGTLTAATLDGNTTCGGDPSDVWYRFVAPGDGTLLVDTCGTNDIGGVDDGVDTVLSLHSACPDVVGDYELTCNDDWPASANSLACDGIDVGGFPVDSYVELPVAADEEVLIRVSRFVDSFDGPFALRVRHRPPPGANNRCRDAIVVAAGTHLGTLVSATVDGEATCNDPPSPDVWYSYTATTTGTLHVNTCGSNDMGGLDAGVDTIVSVHSACPTGADPNQLPNACNDDWVLGNDPAVCDGVDLGADLDSGLTVQVTQGLEYVIRVAPYPDTLEGEFMLTLAPEGAGAGYVPDGGAIAGSPLLMDRLAGGLMRLTWDASCVATDSDFAIYEGTLGNFGTYQFLACSSGGALTRDEPLPAGSHFYLVVPHNGIEDGSYGLARDATGATLERAPAASACRAQLVAACP